MSVYQKRLAQHTQEPIPKSLTESMHQGPTPTHKNPVDLEASMHQPVMKKGSGMQWKDTLAETMRQGQAGKKRK